MAIKKSNRGKIISKRYKKGRIWDKRRIMRLLRRACYVCLVLLLIPMMLLVLYALPITQPPSTLMLRDMVLLRDYDRQWIPLEEMAPRLVQAVMMSEDGRFCEHHGVDWSALHAELTRDGGPSRGASTITMQMVKNLFLWHERSYLRKGLEVPLALMADGLMSKKRVMEIYLNIAEWGPGIYGVEAASQFYFKREASKLTPRQAALLATTLPNPYLRNPTRPGAGMNRLAQIADARARRSGAYIGCLR